MRVYRISFLYALFMLSSFWKTAFWFSLAAVFPGSVIDLGQEPAEGRFV